MLWIMMVVRMVAFVLVWTYGLNTVSLVFALNIDFTYVHGLLASVLAGFVGTRPVNEFIMHNALGELIAKDKAQLSKYYGYVFATPLYYFIGFLVIRLLAS